MRARPPAANATTGSRLPGDPRVLWPAPGAPALLAAGGRQIELLVVEQQGSAEAVRRWATDLRLVPVGEGLSVPLSVDLIEQAPASWARRHAASVLQIAETAGATRWRVTLRARRALAPAPPRRVRVFDLVRGGSVVRSRSIACHRTLNDRLRIAFASDLHVAAVWDTLAEIVARHAPDLLSCFLHPHENVARLVQALNSLASSGDVDAAVLGGDLVDHVIPSPRAQASPGASGSNVELLVDLLAALRVPTFAVAGNHDYRVYPWRPGAYGLEEVGISAQRREALLRAAGLAGKTRLRLSDLDALRTTGSDGQTGLSPHLLFLAPRTDFSVRFGSVDLIFVTTGRDLVPRWRSLELARLPLLLRNIRPTWLCPDLDGLQENQIEWLERRLLAAESDGQGAAIFQHAPLLHPPEHGGVEAYLDRIPAPVAASLRERVAFERCLHRSGLRHGVFFRNPALLVSALRRSNTAVSLFSGHVHRGHVILYDRDSGHVRSSSLGPLCVGRAHVPLVTAPSLGQTDVRQIEDPGFFVATFSGGRLTQLERHRVARAPLAAQRSLATPYSRLERPLRDSSS